MSPLLLSPLCVIQVPYFSINLKMVLIMIVLGMSVINGTMAFAVIFTSGVGKNGSTVAVSASYKDKMEDEEEV